jgi:pumilio RNA-binding family
MDFSQYDAADPSPIQRSSSGDTDSSGHKATKDSSPTSGSEQTMKNKNANLTHESCLQLAKDQSGCRMLQKRLEEGDATEHANLYNLILPNFVELMNNPFGNYLCQKITEKCNKQQLKEMINIIATDAVTICCNSHGTRAIQKIVERAYDQELVDMVIGVLKDHVRTLVEDINGNHAIQKILFTFKAPNNEFIFDKMIEQCYEIACHKHGCCVMQKCIQGGNLVQKNKLIDEIIKNTQKFVRNAYGNYVVQFVLDLKDFDINTRIGSELLGSLIELGNEKYSSNVIEKCLELNHKDIKNQMVKEMLTADSYIDFLTDQYGNYVIQKTLGVAEKDDLEKLIVKIKPDMETLKKHSEFGSKIYNKLVKTYPSLQNKNIKTSKNSKKSSNKSNKV